MDFLKKASQLADEMLNSVNEMVNRLNTTTKLYAPEDAKGLTAEISVSVQDGGTGEVMVVLGQSLRNFPARAARAGDTFKRGEKVLIQDVGPNVVYVAMSELSESGSNGHKTPGTKTEAKSVEAPQIEKSENKQQSKRSRRKKKSG